VQSINLFGAVITFIEFIHRSSDGQIHKIGYHAYMGKIVSLFWKTPTGWYHSFRTRSSHDKVIVVEMFVIRITRKLPSSFIRQKRNILRILKLPLDGLVYRLRDYLARDELIYYIVLSQAPHYVTI